MAAANAWRLLCIAACTLIFFVAAPSPSSAAAPENPEIWFRSAKAAVRVQLEPFVRVLEYRPVGGVSAIKDGKGEFDGIRTWYMEPGQTKNSGAPARQRGRVISQSPQRMVIESNVAPECKLQLVTELLLNDNAELTIRHGVRNADRVPRTIAVWAITSVPNDGVISMPWPASPNQDANAPANPQPHVISYLAGTDPRDPALVYGIGSLEVHPSNPGAAGSGKIGMYSSAGVVKYTSSSGAHLQSSSSPIAKAEYPEGGANVTAYWALDPRGWAEMENVGPLNLVAPGGTAWLEQVLK